MREFTLGVLAGFIIATAAFATSPGIVVVNGQKSKQMAVDYKGHLYLLQPVDEGKP